MGMFEIDDLDGLIFSFEEIEALPFEVLDEMLAAGCKVVESAQKAAAPKNTGRMAESIKASRTYRSKDGAHKYVNPTGTHHTSAKSRYRNKGGGGRTVTNEEVAFIHEYGAPSRNIFASQWMGTAIEKCADETVDAEETVYNNWLNNL